MVLRRLLLLLTALTLLGLTANAFWMNRLLRIDGHGPAQQLTVVDDRSDGGQSKASMRQGAVGPLMVCELSPGYDWPYCELQVQFDASGLDMQRFDRIRLWLRASGPEPVVRIFLRNRDAAFAGSGRVADLKPHELVIDPRQESMPIDIPLHRFMVSSWWLQQNRLPLRDSGPQLDRIAFLSIGTGGGVPPGRYEIELERAELHGQWVSAARFRLGLIALWMGSLLGYLLWEWRQTRRQLQHSLRHKQRLQQAHAALQLQSHDLAKRAHHDPLTGLLNRAGLQQQIEQWRQLPTEMAFPLSLVFVDVDRFKRINDEHGHEVGDAVLRQLAKLLPTNLQRVDLVARWGGEEFLLLLPQTSAAQAAAVAERLRHCLHTNSWPAGLTVTASFGVANCAQPEALSDALRAADQAMYRAKSSGRDRVEVAVDGES